MSEEADPAPAPPADAPAAATPPQSAGDGQSTPDVNVKGLPRMPSPCTTCLPLQGNM